jgi:hypothetical protein
MPEGDRGPLLNVTDAPRGHRCRLCETGSDKDIRRYLSAGVKTPPGFLPGQELYSVPGPGFRPDPQTLLANPISNPSASTGFQIRRGAAIQASTR